MSYLPLLIGVACAVLFYRAAEYERMSPWPWSISSLGLSIIVSFLTQSIVVALLVQAGLFMVMWWYNARRSFKPPDA